MENRRREGVVHQEYGSGVVGDLLLGDRPVDVVGPEGQAHREGRFLTSYRRLLERLLATAPDHGTRGWFVRNWLFLGLFGILGALGIFTVSAGFEALDVGLDTAIKGEEESVAASLFVLAAAGAVMQWRRRRWLNWTTTPSGSRP